MILIRVRPFTSWSLVACLIMVDGVQASTYCLGGGQLAGAIFGTILGTVAVLAAVFLAFLYLRASRAKGHPGKDATLDIINADVLPSPTNSKSNTLATDQTGERCQSCGHPRYTHEDEKRDQNGIQNKTGLSQVPENGDKGKLMTEGLGSECKTPHRLRQNSANDRNSSEFRTKKKRSGVFSSWWTHHASSKRRFSHSTESLNSVNEVARVTLKSRDVNGLGFNICGNLRDGIFVRSLSNRGPAKESGNMREGDRILSVTINFENIVFEDALTIISYASAYPVTLELQRADSIASQKRMDNAFDLTPIGTKCLNSDKPSSGSKSNKAMFHPLFKSQSIDDVSSYRSISPGIYSHIFDAIDATLEARRSKSLQYSPEIQGILANINSTDTTTPKPKPLCSLEVIEETPQLLRRSPIAPRKILDDAASLGSTASSVDATRPSNGASGDNPSPTTITVTAEINAPNCRDEEDTIVLDDPYAGLSYEERLQIIRLSYEDADLSRGSPASSQARCESQLTTVNEDPSQKVLDEFIKSPSPTLDSFLVSMGDSVRQDQGFLTTSTISVYSTKETIRDDEAGSAEDDMLSNLGDSPSSLESSSTEPQLIAQNLFPVNATMSDRHQYSLTSPSGSSIGTSSTESDRLSSPEQSKRDSGYDGNGNGVEDDVEKAQYEKLLYFQRQLAKQHEELARLGIHIPMPTGTMQSSPVGGTHRPHNGHYTSA